MGVLEDVVVNIKSAVDMVGKKTGQIVDISKLKINQTELNNEISKYFKELGKITYQAEKSQCNDAKPKVDECVSIIDDLYIQLRAVTEQITSLKNKKRCKNCGHENDIDMMYCGKCGDKLYDVAPPAETESKQEVTAEATDVSENNENLDDTDI